MKYTAILFIAALFLGGCTPNAPIVTGSSPSHDVPTTAAVPVTGPTSGPAAAPPADLSSIKHVFVIMMENRGYDQVWNSPSTPYITSLGKEFARATDYHSVIHPSLPNYLQLIAGSNFTITSDCLPSDTCHVSGTSIADSLEAKGLSWRAYMEGMPSPCFLNTSGAYYPKHNPFLYFDNIRNNPVRCALHDVPYTALQTDLLTAATTPNFAFIAPNQCNDMHSCPVSAGDTWLKKNVPAILKSPACTSDRSDKCLLIVTWDEDDRTSNNQVLTIFAGSAAQSGGVTSAAAYSHYSLLHTIEDIFGLPTLTTNDVQAAAMMGMLK